MATTLASAQMTTTAASPITVSTDIGTAVIEQHLAVIDHPSIDASHREGHADEQTKPDPREDELAP